MKKFYKKHHIIINTIIVIIVLVVSYLLLDLYYLRPYSADFARCTTGYTYTAFEISEGVNLPLPGKSCYIGTNINSGASEGDYIRFMTKSSDDNLEEKVKADVEGFNNNSSYYKIDNYIVRTINNIRKEIIYYVTPSKH